jgi:hypothetical protein
MLFGEAFRDVAGAAEVVVDLKAGETVGPAGPEEGRPCSIGAALVRAGIDRGLLDGTRGELPALVILNDRVLLPADRFSVCLKDGDVVRFQLMLTGG